jgi:hypothetical protein
MGGTRESLARLAFSNEIGEPGVSRAPRSFATSRQRLWVQPV